MGANSILHSLQKTLGASLPNIGVAFLILIIGWIGALVLRAALRRLLGMIKLNQHLAHDVEMTEMHLDIESVLAGAGFWLVILLTVVGVLNALDLPGLSSPFEALVREIAGYLPRAVNGSVLAVIAWLMAMLLRGLATRMVAVARLEDRLLAAAGMQPLAKSLGNILFWLVILLFLPAIIGAYEIENLLAPLSEMLNRALAMLPNVFTAFLIGFIGWLVGRALSTLTVVALAAAGLDRVGKNAGLSDATKLSSLAGSLVMIAVFLPSMIAALDAMKVDTIAAPASLMLGKMMDAVPQVIAAIMILTLTFFIARFVAILLQQFLISLGVDAVPEKIGLGKVMRGQALPSTLAGSLLKFFAMLFATLEAAAQLEFDQVTEVVTMFIEFGGDVLLGGVIFTVGFWLSNLAHDAIARGGSDSMARIARIAILGLVISMGLRAMGIADDIVNMAFAFTLGAVAVAIALSFGLGGREAAGRQMEYWFSQWRSDKNEAKGEEKDDE
jgi:Conserved TM helix